MRPDTFPRLVIFDWDGTLMDSEHHIVACLHAAMDDLGLERLPAERVRGIIGLGLREAVEGLFPGRGADDAFVDRFVAAYRSHFFDPAAGSSLFEGAREVVEQLYGEGFLLAVATGKSRRGLEMALDQTGLRSAFHVTRCADESRSKPHPQMLCEILDEVGVAAAEAVMVGDTEFDLAMAVAAGVGGIGVSYGVHEVERLKRHRPLALIHQIRELPHVLIALPKETAGMEPAMENKKARVIHE